MVKSRSLKSQCLQMTEAEHRYVNTFCRLASCLKHPCGRGAVTLSTPEKFQWQPLESFLWFNEVSSLPARDKKYRQLPKIIRAVAARALSGFVEVADHHTSP